MRILAELRRRNVIRVAGFYLVASWLIVQVADTLLPVFDGPGWVMKVLVGLLAAGAIPTLIFSWVYELTPEGLRRESEIDPVQSAAVHTARKLDVAVILLLLAIGALTLWGPKLGSAKLGSESTFSGGPAESPKRAEKKVDSDPNFPAKTGADPASIAVLPFADLSPGGDQAYFSDGMSEEILNALVKVSGLQVASRTSSFGFKGQEALGVPAIAEKLAVRHVLEGSVRRAGNTLRITAQLIDAETDRHLWSETYDRPLTAENVFAIQDEIATAIVAALKTSLAIADVGDVALTQPTANLGAYDLYLRARALFLARRDLAEAERLLQQALEQDADFAKAWELRAAVNSIMHEYRDSTLGAAELGRRSAEYARRALSLDPDSSMALATLANVRSTAGRGMRERADFAGIVADLERAIEIDPHNSSAMNWLGIALALLGDSTRALTVFEQCSAIDPTFGPCMENRYDTLWVLGQSDAAYAQMLDGWSRGVNVDDYVNYPLLAHFEQRAAFLLALTKWLPQWRRGDALYEAFRHPERDHSALRDELVRFVADSDPGYYRGALLIPLGAFDEPPPSWLLWSAEFARYRQSPQFRQFIDHSGVLAYWQAKGFPDQCRAVPPDSFECD
jgi:TolB-like protein/Tfp pilus assembly protein PilF